MGYRADDTLSHCPFNITSRGAERNELRTQRAHHWRVGRGAKSWWRPSQPVPLMLGFSLSPQTFSGALNKYVRRTLHVPRGPSHLHLRFLHLHRVNTETSLCHANQKTLVPYLGPPENRITFLDSIVMLDAFYSSWFLQSTTAHTSISSSYPSLRHTPLACPQARSSCGSHILFYHRVFLKFENKDREVTYAMGREIHESANLRFINFSRKIFLFLKYMSWF